MEIPVDIKWLYLIECGFNLHSIYATLFLDTIKKDLHVMLVHHLITVLLLFVSYSTRYFKIGLLVLFFHDICDIWLEVTRFNHHIKFRNGKSHLINDLIANVGFVLFALSWLVFRLYFFPLKVLYSTGGMPF